METWLFSPKFAILWLPWPVMHQIAYPAKRLRLLINHIIAKLIHPKLKYLIYSNKETDVLLNIPHNLRDHYIRPILLIPYHFISYLAEAMVPQAILIRHCPYGTA